MEGPPNIKGFSTRECFPSDSTASDEPGGKDPRVVKGTGDRHPIKFDIENGSKSSQTTSNVRKII